MNKFELFTMIFYALDLYYDHNPSEELGRFLSEMSPFTFKQVGSADPAVFKNFCDFIGNEEITIENSYEKAQRYIANINDLDLETAFMNTDEEKWVKGCEKYLTSDHKGADIP